jgi:hypothetical protein
MYDPSAVVVNSKVVGLAPRVGENLVHGGKLFAVKSNFMRKTMRGFQKLVRKKHLVECLSEGPGGQC